MIINSNLNSRKSKTPQLSCADKRSKVRALYYASKLVVSVISLRSKKKKNLYGTLWSFSKFVTFWKKYYFLNITKFGYTALFVFVPNFPNKNVSENPESGEFNHGLKTLLRNFFAGVKRYIYSIKSVFSSQFIKCIVINNF